MSDDPFLQLFTMRVACMVSNPQMGVGTEATVFDVQMAHLQASKMVRVRDASGWDGGGVDVVACGPLPMGELDTDCEAL